jgi:transcriptional regulator with XRE-family HTH domain
MRTDRRDEFAAFLRTRRERLSPADVGLPAGTRRRVAGLRREEVATLAGVGLTWYTWLEQGRPIAASDQVLGAIARALRMTEDEQDHLFALAGATPPERDEHACVSAAHLDLLSKLMPYPAAVQTARFTSVRTTGRIGFSSPTWTRSLPKAATARSASSPIRPGSTHTDLDNAPAADRGAPARRLRAPPR